MSTRMIVGTVFEALATLPDRSVDLVASSPPFLAVRSYLPADHPTKAKEIGSEATPAHFLDALLDVAEACDRVLAPHGSLCFELGTTFAGSGGAGGDYGVGGLREGQSKFAGSALKDRKNKVLRPDGNRLQQGPGWPQDKSMAMVATLFPACLAYGRNLLRPERQTPPWRIRNVISWTRPNPAVGALGDKCRPATSWITVATKSRARYWDMDAVRVPLAKPNARNSRRLEQHPETSRRGTLGAYDASASPGAPLLDWWAVPTQPSKLAHFAMWPEEIARRLILLMCPERVCTTCGESSRRITATEQVPTRRTNGRKHYAAGTLTKHFDKRTEASVSTLSWTTCGHDTWRRGVVLDPFGGSGTTGAVASQLGRDAVLIDLNEANVDLARKRVQGHGLLEVVERDGAVREAQGQGVLA